MQTSGCTITVPNSVRTSAPVGQTSRQAACVQCLHTSEAISQRVGRPVAAGDLADDVRSAPGGTACSMNATCRQLLAPSAPVLS